MAAHHDISPSTKILDANGYDWAWAYVVFRPVVDYPGYAVGSDGSVWSIWSRGGRTVSGRKMGTVWRALKPGLRRDGYLRYRLYRKGFPPRDFAGHTLVLEAFHCPRPSGMEACHGDRDRKNNRLSNLRWDTPQANYQDAVRHGTASRGVMNGLSKLGESDISMIRRMVAAGHSYREVGRRLGMCASQIGNIARCEAWKHVV